MIRRFSIFFLAALSLAALAAYTMAPAKLANTAPIPDLEGDLTRWLTESERAANEKEALVPGTEKRLRWYQGKKNSKTRYSIVYLHGFSATRQEIAPVGALVADGLEANLFETRLAGHGRQQRPLENISAEDWLADAAEALAIGAMIGEQVIVMGTSTGATLALSMAGHAVFEPVSALVLFSPNFATSDTNAEYLTWPGGPQLAYLVAGKTRSWTAQNDLQAKFWTTTYPMAAVIEMMRLVKYVRARLPLRLQQSVLMIYSPEDTVVDVDWIVRGFEQLETPRKQLIEIAGSEDQSNHILAGNIMAPENNELITGYITRFILDREVAQE